MSCNPSKIWIWFALVAICATGCTPTKPIFLNDTGDLSYYVEQATKVEYPDVEYASLDEVTMARAPMTVLDPDFQSFEDITLEDAVSYALANSKVIRGYGTPSLQSTRVAPGQDNLSNGPAAAATTYNVAIRETEPGFLGAPGQIASPSALVSNTALDGNQGVESALADFDAQLTSSFNYTKGDEPRNSDLNFFNAEVFQQDQVQWQTEIAKKSANGTQIFFRNVNQYTSNNNPLIADGGLQALDSFYRAAFEAEIRQPLLRGRGAYINRMPIVISKLGTDQEIANLEATLQNKVTNIEIRYWDLYCAYRSLDAAKTGRDAALETWRIVKNQYDEGAEVNIQQLAQASEQYHFFEARVIDSYHQLLDAEGTLRYLLGWAATDGRFLRPIDEPVLAPIEFDWTASLCEALTYRPELRQQRIEIKKRELAFHHSKNGLLPELNVSLLYRWLGLGNRFGTSSGSEPFTSPNSGALNELYGGNFQEVQIGGTFAMPIGYRRELANVRNAQLKLARELARVEDMELDITKNLGEAIRALATNQKLMVSYFNRWKDTTIEEQHFDRLNDAGVETLDVALDAQRRRSDAEVAFYQAVCEYNKIIALIHRRKGTILPYSGVGFSEGPWAGKAYIDAQEHARRRGASQQLNYGWSRPEVVGRGEKWPTAQNIGHVPAASTIPVPQGLTGQPITIQSDEIAPLVAPGIITSEVINPGDGQVIDSFEGAPILNIPETSTETDATPLAPTPATIDSASRQPNYKQPNYRQAAPSTQYQVQQVGYDQPVVNEVPIAAYNQTTSNQTTSARQTTVQPAAVLKEKYRKKPVVGRNVAPKQDTSNLPARRLRAVPQSTSKAASQGAKNRNNQSSAVLRKGNLSWEKFGLSRPSSQATGTTAKIKTNQ